MQLYSIENIFTMAKKSSSKKKDGIPQAPVITAAPLTPRNYVIMGAIGEYLIYLKRLYATAMPTPPAT